MDGNPDGRNNDIIRHKRHKKGSSSSSGLETRCRKRSRSSDSSSAERKKKYSKKKLKHRRKRSESTSSSNSSTNSDSDERYERKRRSKEKRRAKKLKKKLKKEKKKEAKKKKQVQNEECNDVPIKLMEKSKAMAPMTKEEWEKKQSVICRVYDENTGRHRLIKGDGEVIEEIVSRDRHLAINRQATAGDGKFFQSKLNSNLSR